MKKFLILLLLFFSFALLGCKDDSNEAEGYVTNKLFNNGLLGVCNSEGKCGYLNEDFEVEIPLEYDSIGRFQQGIAMVESSNHYGIINSFGKVIVPIEYNKPSFNFEHQLIKLEKDDGYHYFDFDGKELSFKEAHLEQGFSEDTLFGYSRRYIYTTTGGYETAYGYTDIDGNIVIEATFDRLHDDYFTNTTIVEKSDYNYVTLSRTGETSSYFCRRVWTSFFDGYFTFQIQDYSWGITDSSGNISVDAIYENPIILNENGYGVVETKDGLFGLVKYNGDIIVEPIYHLYHGSYMMDPYQEDGFIVFYDNTTYYLYNSFGELIYTSEDFIFDMFQHYVISRDQDTSKYSVTNIETNEVLRSFDSYDLDSNKDYLFIRDYDQDISSSAIYDKNMNLVDIEFDFLPRYGSRVDNQSDDAFLSVINYDNNQIFLYNSDREFIYSLSLDALYNNEFINIYDDGYITYYDSDHTLVVLNVGGEEVFRANENPYLILYEAFYTWTH